MIHVIVIEISSFDHFKQAYVKNALYSNEITVFLKQPIGALNPFLKQPLDGIVGAKIMQWKKQS